MAVLALTSCRSDDALSRSATLAEQHNHYQAYWTIALALETYPDDPELERVFWERRLAYLLDRGRELVFHEREVEAIGEFQKALALDPDNVEARLWIARAKQKLAKELVREAEGLRHEGKLEAALKRYNKAASYIPEYPEALAGIEEVGSRYQRRTDRASEHYVLGSRARGEQQFQQSYYHSGLAAEIDVSMSKARKLRDSAGKRLARGRLDHAKEMEGKGFYAAALRQYLQVQTELPGTKGLQESIAQMEKEVEARDLSRQAEMLVRKGEFDRADELLQQAFAKTEFEKANVSGLMLDAKRRRHGEAYLKAKDLEHEHLFEAALEAYREIDKAWPQGFRDIKARISGLMGAIEEAAKAWTAGQAAEKKGDLDAAIDHYEEAVLVYPGYKGLEEHLKRLRARR